mmetsp:Transcript_6008/g.9810  ORF Transcript_6008/g.9810 Transcript_6008/m.9810 type:complete len:418 (-) Transcript_6008:241-1494(-)
MLRSRQHSIPPDPTPAMDDSSPKKQKAGSRPRNISNVPIICAAAAVITILLSSSKMMLKQSSFSSSSTNNLRPTKPKMDYHIDNKCFNLPTIKPAGTSFLNTPKFKKVLSPDNVSPSYYIGSVYGDRVRRHMSTDLVHFKLIKEHLISWSKLKKSNSASSSKTSEATISGVAFDLGANQGFFTYYLAALGLDVHAFEINAENFQSLQHGQHYNGKSVAERVNLYPVGVDNKVHRFDMSGGSYEGYIKQKADSKNSNGDDVGSDEKAASILAVTFDCFAHHSKIDLSTIPFVKIDVEGFEIAALMGASNSLFSKNTKIGAMLMEVGPDRWNRASIDLETGIQEMAKVSTHFKQTYILLRKEERGGTCPVSIAEGVLADDKPEVIEDKVHKHKVAMNEWKGLLTKMNDNHWDCNFWYTN